LDLLLIYEDIDIYIENRIN